ncbi:MAG: DNA polymerase IV [Nocardioidaceae bacterium]
MTSAALSDAGCTILHVDMDAFYASVAIRDRPQLRGTPVIVGGGHRGVVLSASYEARVFGVHSAMPMMRARRLCPTATVLSPDFDRFTAVSAAVQATFRAITPQVEAMSLDEAFLDVSGSVRRLGPPRRIAEQLRSTISDEQGIPCSVGIATTTHLAKLASRRAKPDGVVVVPRDGATAFLHPLDVEELWGVGDKTAEALRRLGLRTIGDLAHTPVDLMRRALGPTLGPTLHALAWGGGRRTLVAQREPERSIGSDETFGRDTDDPVVVTRELLRLSTSVAGRLRAAAVVGRTVTLRVRFADFTTITRSRTLRDATDIGAEIYATACALFEGLGLQRARIRLVGVRVEGLRPAASAPRQLVLGERPHGWPEAERAVDAAARRFGHATVGPARLLGTGRP